MMFQLKVQVLSAALLISSLFSIAQTTLYSEDFTGQNGKGAEGGSPSIVVDTVGVSWAVDTSDVNFQDADDYVKVVTERIEFRDTEGRGKWISPSINVSNYDSLSLTIDLLEVGGMEASDSILVYYQIDGGVEIEIKTINDDFTSYTLTDTAISDTGSELHIVVYGVNGATDEKHRIDNIIVKGNSTITVDGIGLSSLGTAVQLTFDASISGSNNGEFSGSGISNSPSNGQLNSSGISISGFSDGDVAFDSTKTSGDYSRGTSTGGVSSGGLYAFEIASGDFALGHQMTGSDFNPGKIDFRLKNNSGSTATKLLVSYDIYEYNDQGRSTSCELFSSSDNSSYNAVSSSTINTTEAASGAPAWVKSSVSKTITGLTWNNGDFFYVRFQFDDNSGSGSRDEIALDNITFTAKDNATPAATPASLSGAYANIIVDYEADASASADVTITNSISFVNGKINLNGNKLTLGTDNADATVSGASSSSYLYGGTVKYFINNSTNSYTFPMGSSSSEYSPVVVDFNSSTLASTAFVETQISDAKHPNFSGNVVNYIDRNWTVEQTGITSPDYNIVLSYVDADVFGNETDILPVKYSGGTWTAPGNIGNNNVDTVGAGSINDLANTLTWNGVTSFSIYGGAGNGIPLPVQLLSFEGKYTDQNAVELNWKTASELNNHYFEVIRLNENAEGTVLGTVEGNGTSNKTNSYRFIDDFPLTGVNYYVLEQYDFDGNTERHNAISVSTSNEKTTPSSGFSISQNTYSVIIKSEKDAISSIELISLSGEKIESPIRIISSQESELALQSVAKGAYLIKVVSASNIQESFKILK